MKSNTPRPLFITDGTRIVRYIELERVPAEGSDVKPVSPHPRTALFVPQDDVNPYDALVEIPLIQIYVVVDDSELDIGAFQDSLLFRYCGSESMGDRVDEESLRAEREVDARMRALLHESILTETVGSGSKPPTEATDYFSSVGSEWGANERSETFHGLPLGVRDAILDKRIFSYAYPFVITPAEQTEILQAWETREGTDADAKDYLQYGADNEGADNISNEVLLEMSLPPNLHCIQYTKERGSTGKYRTLFAERCTVDNYRSLRLLQETVSHAIAAANESNRAGQRPFMHTVAVDDTKRRAKNLFVGHRVISIGVEDHVMAAWCVKTLGYSCTSSSPFKYRTGKFHETERTVVTNVISVGTRPPTEVPLSRRPVRIGEYCSITGMSVPEVIEEQWSGHLSKLIRRGVITPETPRAKRASAKASFTSELRRGIKERSFDVKTIASPYRDIPPSPEDILLQVLPEWSIETNKHAAKKKVGVSAAAKAAVKEANDREVQRLRKERLAIECFEEDAVRKMHTGDKASDRRALMERMKVSRVENANAAFLNHLAGAKGRPSQLTIAGTYTLRNLQEAERSAGLVPLWDTRMEMDAAPCPDGDANAFRTREDEEDMEWYEIDRIAAEHFHRSEKVKWITERSIKSIEKESVMDVSRKEMEKLQNSVNAIPQTPILQPRYPDRILHNQHLVVPHRCSKRVSQLKRPLLLLPSFYQNGPAKIPEYTGPAIGKVHSKCTRLFSPPAHVYSRSGYRHTTHYEMVTPSDNLVLYSSSDMKVSYRQHVKTPWPRAKFELDRFTGEWEKNK